MADETQKFTLADLAKAKSADSMAEVQDGQKEESTPAAEASAETESNAEKATEIDIEAEVQKRVAAALNEEALKIEKPKFVVYRSSIVNLKIGKYQFVEGILRVPNEEVAAFDENLARFNSRITSKIRKVTMESAIAKLQKEFGMGLQQATKGFDSGSIRRAEQIAAQLSPGYSGERIEDQGQTFDPVRFGLSEI